MQNKYFVYPSKLVSIYLIPTKSGYVYNSLTIVVWDWTFVSAHVQTDQAQLNRFVWIK